MPKVSVIVPTYNRAKFIERALDSVLNQTFLDFEIIVIDDGSIDNTKEVLYQYNDKIKYIYQNNSGISAARNRGINESLGEYIAFLDSDDFWAPEKLNEQVKVLDSNKKVGIVYVRMPIVNAKGEQLGMKPAGVSGKNFHELLHLWGDLPTSSVMTRKECFLKAGMFDVSLTMSEDTEMWIRIAKFYDLFEIEGKVLAYYYRHDDQITTSRIRVYLEQIKTDLKIISIHKEAPKSLIFKRIASNEYMAGKIFYLQRDYDKSLSHVYRAFKYYLPLGTLFFSKNDNFVRKAMKLINPLGLLIISFLSSIPVFIFQLIGTFTKKKE